MMYKATLKKVVRRATRREVHAANCTIKSKRMRERQTLDGDEIGGVGQIDDGRF